MAKTAATEAQVGRIHQLATTIYEKKLELILKQMEDDPENAEFIGDLRTIQAADKWAQYNEIKSVLPTEQENNPLKAKLAEIKAFKHQVSPTLAKEA